MLRFFILLWLLCFSLLQASNVSAAIDPSIKWETLETPHFRIIFDSRHYPLALRYADYAEQAYAGTLPYFKEAPDKTVVVIDDSVDLANGFATGVPYSLVSAFPVLPTALDSIADYGNWGLELMTHEYTHILQFEPAHGLARPLRWIFGTVLRPNMLLPRWYLEGLAVHMESRLSNHGRLRSEGAMAIPRAMAEENRLRKEDISRLNEVMIPDGVGGLRPYLLGGILWNQMVAMGGESTIGDLNSAYSRRLPFVIEGPAKDRLGFGYAELLGKTYDAVTGRAQEQIDLVLRAGSFVSRPFPKQEGLFNHSPVISPNGNALVYIARTHNQDDRIELVERALAEDKSFTENKRRTVTSGLAVNRASWLPDSSGFVFDKIETSDHYYQFYDLYHVDLKTKKSRRITRKMRAREPIVNPDGKSIVFVQITPGSTRLAQTGLDGKDFKVLYEPPTPQTRISRPEFISANEIIFAEKTDDGVDAFKVLSLADGQNRNQTRSVLTDYNSVAFARWTPEGLLFSSSKTGIENLYLSNPDLTQARPVTNVTTRAMTGEIDPRTRELYFARLGGDGPRIHVAARDAWLDVKVAPPQVKPLLAYEWPDYQPATVEMTPERKDYSVWPYMIPRYWMPFVYFIPGGSYFSATTAAADPLGRHSYSFQASIDTVTDQPSFAGQYVNQTTPVTYSLAAADMREFIYSGNFVRHNTVLTGGAGFYLLKQSTKWKASAGWNYIKTELSTRLDTRSGPRVALEYSDVSQKGFEISPERGYSAVLAHTSYLPDLGNIDYDQTNFLGSYYFSKWLPERHALAFYMSAVYAPRLRNIFLGQSTSAADYGSTLLANDFVMRGYANGSFLGRTMVNTNTEYRFPLAYPFKGWGTKPLFLQRLHGALLLDAITLDGAFYDVKNAGFFRARTGTFFLGYGGELRADVSMFYHLPLQLVFGLYYGEHDRAGLGLTSYIGFTL